MALAKDRPPYPYLKPSAVFCCPADRGQEETSSVGDVGLDGTWKPSDYQARVAAISTTECTEATCRMTKWTTLTFSPAKKEGYVRHPALMILMYEPSAMNYWNYYHWHYARGPTAVDAMNLVPTARGLSHPFFSWTAILPAMT